MVLEEVDEAARLCGAINTVVNTRDENGQVTGKLKGYNTDGMGYWQGITEEGIDFKGMKMDLIVTDTVYAPRETVMMKQAKEAGCTKVYNGMSMMLFQALIAIELYTGKSTDVEYMKEKLGI